MNGLTDHTSAGSANRKVPRYRGVSSTYRTRLSVLMASLQDLIRDLPAPFELPHDDISDSAESLEATFVVIDDDPTGTQSVSNVPVLLQWSVDDIEWALNTGARAVYVMTNSRSLSEADAELVTREVVTHALQAAGRLNKVVDFVSRSDSTLRGHFPLEPRVITSLMEEHGYGVQGTLVLPAFPAAGRVTLNSTHYARVADDDYQPVADTEFARDATFGYRSSDLIDWVSEKAKATIGRDSISALTIDDIRLGPEKVADFLRSQAPGNVIVCDSVVEQDIQVIAHALRKLSSENLRYVCRVGPPFVRALIGQQPAPPLQSEQLQRMFNASGSAKGLVVVGSHTTVTSDQLRHLINAGDVQHLTLDVTAVIEATARSAVKDDLAQRVSQALRDSSVVLSTSRQVLRSADPDESLRIARSVSHALCEIVQRTLLLQPAAWVVAKGGITSSDIASRALRITRARVLGTLLPGLVSVWEAQSGPASGMPYVVFPGNVGQEDSLTHVVNALRSST